MHFIPHRFPGWTLLAICSLFSGCAPKVTLSYHRADPRSDTSIVSSLPLIPEEAGKGFSFGKTVNPSPPGRVHPTAQGGGANPSPEELYQWKWTSVDQLRPVKSSPGILICEPVVSPANPARANFGSGAAQWLHLFVGGNGNASATPLWTSVGRAEQELGRHDLRLTLAQAGKLYSILGISHVALGTLTGRGSSQKLTYRLYSLPAKKPVGTPVVLSGSPEQIAAALPVAAKKLTALMRITGPSLPKATGLRAGDLEFIGKMPWMSDAPLTAEMYRKLALLAHRSPLAGIVLLHAGATNDYDDLTPVARELMKQAPENALTLGGIGYKLGMPSKFPDIRKKLEANRRKYPGSYLFTLCEVWRQRGKDGNPTQEHIAAEKVVRVAFHNPEAWLTLGWTINDAGDRVRQSRFVGQMSPEELKFVDEVYPQWLLAVSRSAKMDPLYGKAWYRVATAACFTGMGSLADAAFWEAARLYKEDREDMWLWGMQMYQPKWLDDSEKLNAVARQASQEFHYDRRVIPILNVLNRVGEEEVRNELFNRMIPNLQAATQSHPDDIDARYYLAEGYLEGRQLEDASRESLKTIQMKPDLVNPHILYSRVLEQMEKYDEAIEECRTALNLNPTHPASIKRRMGRLIQLKAGNRPDEAPSEEPEEIPSIEGSVVA